MESGDIKHELKITGTYHDNQYGSTGTLSTEIYVDSSSSTSSSQNSSPSRSPTYNKHRRDRSHDSINDHFLLRSYSSISSDGGGYYSMYAFSRKRTPVLYNFLRNSVLTRHNFKVTVSFALCFTSYVIMGLLGGSVAYQHFERISEDVPDPLPDFGYDVIPYWCPILISKYDHGNIQTLVLLFLYLLISFGVVVRWKPRCHPLSGKVVWGGDGRLILQQMFHINVLVFLTRTSVVGLTGLPQPNPRCVNEQQFPVTFIDAIKFVMGRGFPPRACGDLIYSGHVGCILVCMAILHRHGFLKNRCAALLIWMIALLGIYSTLSCRSHYSVDVVLAFYFSYFLSEWYFNRSDGRVNGLVSEYIAQIEVRPLHLECLHDEKFNANEAKQTHLTDYPSTLTV